MFKRINIQNFRCIKNANIDDFKRFNLIVGKNNSGKTSLLEALFQSINPGNAALLGKANGFRNLNVIDPDSWKTVFYELDIRSRVRLESELTKINETRTIKVTPIIRQERLLIEKNGSSDIINGDSRTGLGSYVEGLNLNISIIHNGDRRNYNSRILTKKNIKPEPGVLIEPLVTENDNNYICPSNGRYIHRRLLYSDLGERFSRIVIQKRKKQIVKILKRLEPNLRNLELVGELVYADLGYNELIQVNALGDGFLKLFSFLIDIIQMKNGILLIDEVENGLHYTTLDLVWRSIFTEALNFNVQIIATTHSYDCVKAYYNSYNSVKDSLGLEDEIRLFRIERKPQDTYKVIKYDFSNIEKAFEMNWEIR